MHLNEHAIYCATKAPKSNQGLTLATVNVAKVIPFGAGIMLWIWQGFRINNAMGQRLEVF